MKGHAFAVPLSSLYVSRPTSRPANSLSGLLHSYRRHISKGDFIEAIAANQQPIVNSLMYILSQAIPAYIEMEEYTRGYI